jgi:hypothetical protein
MAAPTIFRAVNLPQVGPEPDLFGLWQPVPAAATRPGSPTPAGQALPGEQDFALPAADAGPLCWQIDLSPDPRQAAAELDRAQARLAATMRGLDNVEGRLAGFVASDGLPPPDEVAYGLDAPPPAPEPETDLQVLVDEIARAGRPPSAGEPAEVDFAVLSVGHIAEAVAGYRAFLNQFYQSISNYARVETAQRGHVVARTRVGWTGDMGTAWYDRVTSEQIALHQRSLALALDTRAGLLRIAVLVVQGARLLAQLSVMAAATPSLILAAPAAWRFIQQVLAEARRWQEMHGSAP